MSGAMYMSSVGYSIATSPPARDPLTRLEYLLQNLLLNFTQVVTVIAPEASNSTDVDSRELSNEIKDKITDLTDRVLTILKTIDENIDAIPDSTIPMDEIKECVSKLHEENVAAANELARLEPIFDLVYKKTRDLATSNNN